MPRLWTRNPEALGGFDAPQQTFFRMKITGVAILALLATMVTRKILYVLIYGAFTKWIQKQTQRRLKSLGIVKNIVKNQEVLAHIMIRMVRISFKPDTVSAFKMERIFVNIKL